MFAPDYFEDDQKYSSAGVLLSSVKTPLRAEHLCHYQGHMLSKEDGDANSSETTVEEPSIAVSNCGDDGYAGIFEFDGSLYLIFSLLP